MTTFQLPHHNGNRQIHGGDVCPVCEGPIPNAKAKQIRAAYEAQQRELDAQAKARADKELRAKEAEILARGKAAAAAEANADRDRLLAALEKANQRAESAEQNVDERVKTATGLVRDQMLAEQLKKDRQNFELAETWKKKALALQAAIDEQNAQKKGKDAEKDIARELAARFPNDQIEVIATGVNGADVLHRIFHRGTFIGEFLHESKNHPRGSFRKAWPTKLRADQMDRGCAQGILWANPMPTDVAHPFTTIEEVYVCEFGAGIAVTTALREFAITISTMAHNQPDEAAQVMLNFMHSGRGMELLKTLINNSLQEAKLDRDEQQAHRTVWNKRVDNRAARDNLLQTLIAEIDRIVGGADDA